MIWWFLEFGISSQNFKNLCAKGVILQQGFLQLEIYNQQTKRTKDSTV